MNNIFFQAAWNFKPNFYFFWFFLYFFWLDAGGSRFFDDFDLAEPYPSDSAMESLEGMGESYLVQMNCDYYQDLYGAKELPLDYLWDNRSYVLGYRW